MESLLYLQFTRNSSQITPMEFELKYIIPKGLLPHRALSLSLIVVTLRLRTAAPDQMQTQRATLALLV